MNFNQKRLSRYTLYISVFAIIIGLCVLSPAIASAKIYYVSSSQGKDSNSGTSSSSPWKTISKVNSEMHYFNAGDQILFKRGDTWYTTSDSSLMIHNVSASSDNRIKFGAYGSGARPKFSGNKSSGSDFRGLIVVYGTSRYVTIDNIHVTKHRKDLINICPDTGGVSCVGITVSNCEVNINASGYMGIMVSNQGSQGKTTAITIENNTVHDIGHDGIRIEGGVTNSTVKNNTWYNVPHNAIDTYYTNGDPPNKNLSIVKNRIYYSQQGIYFPGNTNSLIEENDIYEARDHAGWGYVTGIKLEKGTGFRPTSVVVRKNRIWNMDKASGNSHAIWLHNTTNCTLINNTVYSNYSTISVSDNKNLVNKNNLAYANSNDNSVLRNYSSNPRFVDPNGSQPNFQLQGNSPCIDAGVYVGLPYTGAAPDLGAFEYDSQDPGSEPRNRPIPPTGLKIISSGL
jgi:parallel beta-helix repeat protein